MDSEQKHAGAARVFRPELNAALSYTDRTEGGRPPFDPVLMFKILVIQATNNLSDERAEFLINDRLSFMRFLGLGLGPRPGFLASPINGFDTWVDRALTVLDPETFHCGAGETRLVGLLSIALNLLERLVTADRHDL